MEAFFSYKYVYSAGRILPWLRCCNGDPLKIIKHCMQCQKTMLAKRTTKRFCSHRCVRYYRYKNDRNYREKEKKRALITYKQILLKNPEYYARKAREQRAKHPSRFNMTMARFYFKRLNSQQRKKLLAEVK